MEKIQNLAQKRAKHAWTAIEDVKEKFKNEDDQVDYKRQVKRMPVGIMTSGLGHTIAFMHANESKIRTSITNNLADWLLKERKLGVNVEKPNGNSIEEAIRNQDSDFLRRITEESLLYLQWLTRFADAEFKTDKGKKNENDTSSTSS